jgi:hypothetical protein
VAEEVHKFCGYTATKIQERIAEILTEIERLSCPKTPLPSELWWERFEKYFKALEIELPYLALACPDVSLEELKPHLKLLKGAVRKAVETRSVLDIDLARKTAFTFMDTVLPSTLRRKARR